MKNNSSFGASATLVFIVILVTRDHVDGAGMEDATERPLLTISPELKRCNQMIGRYFNGKWEGLEVTYDLKDVLATHGGAPGEVNVTWTEKTDALVENVTDDRPLPDADPQYWIYKYGDTDGKTYARIEHAMRRFSGTAKAILEIRGLIMWTPEDFCGNLRRAYYYVDDRGFTFQVMPEHCWIAKELYGCVLPPRCKTLEDGSDQCAAGPSQGLLAALIGGGK